MNPMFSLKRLQSFLPILNEKSKTILKDLENEIGKPDFDVMRYTSTCTLNAVCSKRFDLIYILILETLLILLLLILRLKNNIWISICCYLLWMDTIFWAT